MITKWTDQIGLSREQSRAFDRWAIDTLGIPGVVLMENAGRTSAEFLVRQCAPSHVNVCIVCGTGNNGGDGFVIARHLCNWGFRPDIHIVGDLNRMGADAAINFSILEKSDVAVRSLAGTLDQATRLALGRADIIVDALLGTGLRGTVREPYGHAIEAINNTACPVLSIDLPSGLDCDTGRSLGDAVRATWTITMVAPKKGFREPHAKAFIGEVYIASIGADLEQWLRSI